MKLKNLKLDMVVQIKHSCKTHTDLQGSFGQVIGIKVGDGDTSALIFIKGKDKENYFYIDIEDIRYKDTLGVKFNEHCL